MHRSWTQGVGRAMAEAGSGRSAASVRAVDAFLSPLRCARSEHPPRCTSAIDRLAGRLGRGPAIGHTRRQRAGGRAGRAVGGQPGVVAEVTELLNAVPQRYG